MARWGAVGVFGIGRVVPRSSMMRGRSRNGGLPAELDLDLPGDDDGIRRMPIDARELRAGPGWADEARNGPGQAARVIPPIRPV